MGRAFVAKLYRVRIPVAIYSNTSISDILRKSKIVVDKVPSLDKPLADITGEVMKRLKDTVEVYVATRSNSAFFQNGKTITVEVRVRSVRIATAEARITVEKAKDVIALEVDGDTARNMMGVWKKISNTTFILVKPK